MSKQRATKHTTQEIESSHKRVASDNQHLEDPDAPSEACVAAARLVLKKRLFADERPHVVHSHGGKFVCS